MTTSYVRLKDSEFAESVILGVCKIGKGSRLRHTCFRLKEEEREFKRLYPRPCGMIVRELKALRGRIRPKLFSTADTDYNVVVPREKQQAHFRLREILDNACLVTSHMEPSDPIWHLKCGLEDLLL